MLITLYTNYQNKIEKIVATFTVMPRVGERIEIDGVEWEVRSVLHQMHKSPAGNSWSQIPTVNLSRD